MKNKLLLMIIICAFILLLVVILCVIIGPKKVKISELKHFTFSYTSGYAMNAYTRYELDYKDNKYEVKVKPYGVAEEAAQTVYVDEDFVKKLETVLDKYNVGSWNGFNKNDKNVLDGDSFSLNATFKDNTIISAHGYMSWPKNYREVREEIYNLFNELYTLDRVYE